MSILTEFLHKHDIPDRERHPLLAECKEWEEITAAAQEWVAKYGHAVLYGEDDALPAVIYMHKLFLETVYTMGYQRAKRELAHPMPQFVVQREGAEMKVVRKETAECSTD